MNKLYTAVIVSLLLPSLVLAGRIENVKDNRDNEGQYVVSRDVTDNTSVILAAPVKFEDDFLGAYVNKYVANENTTALWKTVETSLNAAIALSADVVAGAVAITLDSDSNAERGVLYFGDNECLDMYQGCGFETRLQVSAVATGYTTCVIGLAGGDNADADSIDAHAWFRFSHADNDAWYWETDDGTTDDDDNSCSTALAASTWYVLRIEVWGDYAYFYINGAMVGKGSLAALTSTTGKCQPYIAIQKASGTGVGGLVIDYIKCWGER